MGSSCVYDQLFVIISLLPTGLNSLLYTTVLSV